MRRLLRFAGPLVALCAIAVIPALARRTADATDTVWMAPDYAQIGPQSIAMLPVVTLDENTEARRLTETAVAVSLRPSRHRWTSTLVTFDQITRAGGDSLLKAIREQVRRNARIDSLEAPYYSRLTHSRALLTVRVDQWEKRELEFNESGKPVTTVRLHMALVDSTGRLLWTASGVENAEGPYQDASTNVIGVKENGLTNTPISVQGGAVSYQEALKTLITRIAPQFPTLAPASDAGGPPQ